MNIRIILLYFSLFINKKERKNNLSYVIKSFTQKKIDQCVQKITQNIETLVSHSDNSTTTIIPLYDTYCDEFILQIIKNVIEF